MIEQFYNFTTDEEIEYALKTFKGLEGLYHKNKGSRSTTLFEDAYHPDFIKLVSLYTEKIKNKINKDMYLHSSTILKYKVGDSMELHSDLQRDCVDDIMSMIVYFADDYTGGEIVFPYKDPVFEIKPPRAMAMTYSPHGEENLHYIKEVTSGIKYAMAFCFTTNKKYIKDCYISLYE
jgi:hypothetical protein